MRKKRAKKRVENTTAIVPLRQKELVLNVKSPAFESAVELSKLGLYVTHVLGKTCSVSGWCTENALDGIVSHQSVISWDYNVV